MGERCLGFIVTALEVVLVRCGIEKNQIFPWMLGCGILLSVRAAIIRTRLWQYHSTSILKTSTFIPDTPAKTFSAGNQPVRE